MEPYSLEEKIKEIRRQLPSHVIIEAAVKGRLPEEIERALEAGIEVVGENYVQEAAFHKQAVSRKARWHFIGRLQKNKLNKAIVLFDMIETLSSWDLALALNQRLEKAQKKMDVLVEVNIAAEPQKNGVLPQDTESFVRQVSDLENIRVQGLMTMGPNLAGEGLRPYFREMRRIFDRIKNSAGGAEMKYLSMGMSGSFKVAAEEGANLVRLGTAIFGARP